MARVIVYDPTTNYILKDLDSVDATEVSGSKLVNPVVPPGSFENWVHDSGALREMTPRERQTRVDADKSAARLRSSQEAQKSFDSSDSDGRLLRAVALYLKDQLNVVFMATSLPLLTDKDVMSGIKSKLSSEDVD